jgi:membrane protein DedA with SNARE-associated domain
MDMWQTVLDWLMSNGYLGLFLFGILNFVIPSEVVLPFAGYLVSQNKLNFALVILAALAGNIVKSSVIFWMGKKFGKEFLIRYSRWTHVDQNSIDFAKSRFEHYGYWIIIPGQFIPYFRRFISAPAGLLKLNFGTFLVYNSLGVSLWFGFLASLGYLFDKNWVGVEKQVSPVVSAIGLFVAVAALILFLYEVWSLWKSSKTKI